MRDSGRQLPDCAQLLGAGQLPLLALQPAGDLLDLAHNQLHLIVQAVEIAVGDDVNGCYVLVQMMSHILHSYTEPINGFA